MNLRICFCLRKATTSVSHPPALPPTSHLNHNSHLDVRGMAAQNMWAMVKIADSIA